MFPCNKGHRTAKCKDSRQTDVLNLDLSGVRWVVSQPVVRITTNPEACITYNAAGEATKKRLVFGKLLCLCTTTYLHGSAVAAMGEWRDEQWGSKNTSYIQYSQLKNKTVHGSTIWCYTVIVYLAISISID